jgi:hypothetical protein
MDDLPSYPGTPRWVKISGIVAVVLALLLVIAAIFGGGRHGPGRHLPSGDAGGDTQPASVADDPASPEGVQR